MCNTLDMFWINLTPRVAIHSGGDPEGMKSHILSFSGQAGKDIYFMLYLFKQEKFHIVRIKSAVLTFNRRQDRFQLISGSAAQPKWKIAKRALMQSDRQRFARRV